MSILESGSLGESDSISLASHIGWRELHLYEGGAAVGS